MIIKPDNYDDQELIAFLGEQESQSIESTEYYKSQISERLANGRILRGDPLPWAKTHELIKFGPGQITIWAGMNGHKKSMLLGQVMLWMSRTTKVGIASFEMPVIDTMERMISQAAGCSPSVQFGNQWADWAEGSMYFYDQLDTVPAERVLGVIYHMATELGIKHNMIDSLTKCSLPSGDLGAEKRFIDKMTATAKALGIHIHLVAHVRKPPQGGESHIPNKFDVRGAGELTDLVDNVMIVWADKKKAAINNKIKNSKDLSGTETEYVQDNPDQRLICIKQRYGVWEGSIGLWFDRASLQFTADSRGLPLPFSITELRAA